MGDSLRKRYREKKIRDFKSGKKRALQTNWHLMSVLLGLTRCQLPNEFHFSISNFQVQDV